MKYMLLICDDEQAWAKLSEVDRRDRHRRADPVGAHGHDRSPAARGGRGAGAGVRAALLSGSGRRALLARPQRPNRVQTARRVCKHWVTAP